jgi:hypothetical protein
MFIHGLLEGMEIKDPWPDLKYDTFICLEGKRQTHKKCSYL